MQPLIQLPLPGPDGRVAHIAHTTKADGDLSPSLVPGEELAVRRRNMVPYDWQVVHQVHSDRVVTVDRVLRPRPIADALVTGRSGLPLAVHSGDCVPIGFISEAGYVAAAHAGWKGLEAGVVESTVRQLRYLGGDAPIHAAVGPHIRVDRYEFSEPDLVRLAARVGTEIVGETADGTPGCNLTLGLAAELDRLDVMITAQAPDCTAALADLYWSHRARQEPGRIALIAWIEG